MDDIGCKALLTNMNGWNSFGLSNLSRADYDYVDDHFYIDHPVFIERPWSLPSRCDNESVVARGQIGGSNGVDLRLIDKPFVLSEYNYSGPGKYRGVGGLLTGALAARQDWDTLWRFAYSHNRDNLFKPFTMHYFDIASDPLNQVAERAALTLFLRGDLPPAKALVLTKASSVDLHRVNDRTASRGSVASALTLAARFAIDLSNTFDTAKADVTLTAEEIRAGDASEKIALALERSGVRGAPKDAMSPVNLSEGDGITGGFVMRYDPAADVLTFGTPLTAGGYAGADTEFSAGAIRVKPIGTEATVWVSSTDSDRTPITRSSRLLLCHLTDAQNSNARYAEEERKTLQAWGNLPWIIRDGKAEVVIQRAAGAPALRCWAISLNGERREEIPVRVVAGGIALTLSIRGENGAQMMYELATE